MRIGAYRALLRLCLFTLLATLPVTAAAATYLPLSDTELARRAPLIVRAHTASVEVKLETISGQLLPVTVVTFERLETLKGSPPEEQFQIQLPGGRVGDQAWWIPGTPVFQRGEEVILFLDPPTGSRLTHRLTEFGLSRFDLRADESGRRFAVRPAFGSEEDDSLSMKPISAEGGLREAESFIRALKRIAGGARSAEIAYAQPQGSFRARAPRPLWVNIGGPEGTGNLFRWFWDTGASPSAVVSTSGSQTNLSDSSDGGMHVQNAVDQWSGVASTDVRYSGVGPGGNVTVFLDATSSFDGGGAWNTPLPCTSGGVIGLGGPGSAFGPRTFRGDSNYFAARAGTVSMRQRTGGAGCYSAAVFRSAVLHEMGHTLGLGHPDKLADGSLRTQADESIHSTTSPADWAAAVMAAVIHSPYPSTPQTDDIAGIQWYYGTGVTTQPPVANFSAPETAAINRAVAFADTSTGSPTSWSWAFGDGGTSAQQNPSHTYGAIGVYTVTLTVSNSAGSSTISKPLSVSAVSSCVSDPQTLCLNGARFRVRVVWSAPSQGTGGIGTAVPLTSDTGYFWFFSAGNVELVIKALDGRAFNNHYWVLYGALSDVQYTITVTDTVTNAVKTYTNQQGNLASVADVSAFSPSFASDWGGEGSAGAATSSSADGDRSGVARAVALARDSFLSETVEAFANRAAGAASPVAEACSASPTSLCLNQNRFSVRVSWAAPSQGTSGTGMAVPLTSDTGYFWFFSSTNVELVVKVLDGHAVNNHFWVFYGALSDVAYTVTVTDTQTGAIKTYSNVQGNLASVADVTAF